MSQRTVILSYFQECPEKHLRHIDGASWMVTTTDVSAKYFSAGGVSQILVLSVFRAAADTLVKGGFRILVVAEIEV